MPLWWTVVGLLLIVKMVRVTMGVCCRCKEGHFPPLLPPTGSLFSTHLHFDLYTSGGKQDVPYQTAWTYQDYSWLE